MENWVGLFRRGDHSLMVSKDEEVYMFDGRGISDLYRLLTERQEVLREAKVADKVVGKGAAALMIVGGVCEVYAEVISMNALELFRKAQIHVEYTHLVPFIINHKGDGMCPVEALCQDCSTASACIPMITEFIESIKQH